MEELLRDQSVLLIDGPRWKSAVPQTTRDISAIDDYCIIWVPEDLQQLPADYIEDCNDWYCRGEYATIQFLRCKIVGTVITQGRFAIWTRPEHAAAVDVERRYKFLRRTIKKSYRNSVVRWHNPYIAAHPGEGRSPNPSEPDRSVWVGPAAMSWLAEDASRRIKLFLTMRVEGAVDRPG